MALLQILHYPDSRLRQQAKPVEGVDEEVRQLISDMAETMYQEGGIGLAAIQVNVQKRIFVLDISSDKSGLQAFINPEITAHSGEQVYEEGCLSVPGVYEPVKRAEHITVKALDMQGKSFTLEASGLFAVCIQHEIDHLDGVVFVDRLSRLKKQRLDKKITKQQRLAI